MLAIIRIAQHAWHQLWSLHIFCKGGNTRGGGRVCGVQAQHHIPLSVCPTCQFLEGVEHHKAKPDDLLRGSFCPWSCLWLLVNAAHLFSFSQGYYKNSWMLQSTSNTSTKCFLVILLHLISCQSFKRCTSWILTSILHILCCFCREERIIIYWRFALL